MVMVAMIIVIVMIIVVVMIIVIVMIIAVSMNDAVEVFSFSINCRRTNGGFNGKRAVVGETPLEDVTELAINGVMLGFAIKVGLETAMPLDCDYGSDAEFTLWKLLASAMATMGVHTANCGITGEQQSKS